MRKFYLPVITLILSCFVMFVVSSCKKDGFLGATSTTNLSQNTVFSDSSNAVGFLANIYSNTDFAISPSRFAYKSPTTLVVTPCGGLDAACDESEMSHTFSTDALSFAIGAVNAGNVGHDAFDTCYYYIRAVNQLFKNLPIIPIKTANKTQMKAEARFLRAWYYFILLEHYGGVPIVGDNIYDYTQKIPEVRSTFEQTVNYITSQCDSAAMVLPTVQSGLNYGRASAGACYALEARVLLYAASPLFNKAPGAPGPNGNKAPMDIASAQQLLLVGYGNYSVARWAAARDAAAKVVGLGAYSLSQGTAPLTGYGTENAFQYLFTQRVNTEYIFQFMMPSANSILEGLFQPPSRTGANGAFPYQGMVDAFPMANGLPITNPNSGYDPNNPYANRDPRLLASIIYDQSLLGVRTPNGQISGYSPVNIYLTPDASGVLQGGTDAVYQGTPTGYYNNKMLDPNAISEGFFNQTARCLPLIRYAEILLDYAEAENEVSGPDATVYELINPIRQRAGLVPYAVPAGISQDSMRTTIQNERRVELAYEGHRFWDVRRWLIADQTENIEAQGMEVDRYFKPTVSTTFKKFVVRQHLFHTAMYLWPFPQNEIGKGAGLIQNPGY
jgi:hypothetical protein